LKPEPNEQNEYMLPREVKALGDHAIAAGRDVNIYVGRESGEALPEMDRTLIRFFVASRAKELQSQLDRLRDEHRAGRVRRAMAIAMDWLELPEWESLPATLRSKVFRFLAACYLASEESVQQCEKFLKKAEQADPLIDTIALRGVLIYESTGAEAALAYLEGKSGDFRCLKLDLQLALSQPQVVLQEVGSLPSSQPGEEEIAIPAAQASLLVGDISSARSWCDLALTQRSGHFAVMCLDATLDWLTAVVPTGVPSSLWHLPVPIDPRLIRKDAYAQKMIARAEEKFTRLLENCEYGHGMMDYLLLWQIACLGWLEGRWKEAEKLLQELLYRRPGFSPAVVWALYQNFDFDLERSELALRAAMEAKTSFPGDVLALVSLMDKKGDKTGSIGLLKTSRTLFRENGALDTWILYKIGAAGSASSEDNELISQTSAVEMRYITDAIVLEKLAKAGEGWDAYIAHLRFCYERTGKAYWLIDLAEALMESKNVQAVVDLKDILLQTIPTPSGLRVIIRAFNSLCQWQQCLDLLDAQAGIYGSAGLPLEMQRHRIAWLVQRNQEGQAFEEMERIVETTNNQEDWLNLLQLRPFVGSEFLRILRRIQSRDDLPSMVLLEAAKAAESEAPELATVFFKRVVSRPVLDADEVRAAIGIGYALGCDDLMGALMGRVNELALQGEGTFQMLNLDEVLEMINSRKEVIQRTFDSYRNGKIAVHSLISSMNIRLAEAYLGWTSDRESGVANTLPSVFVRHGGRPTSSQCFPLDFSGRLIVEASAIMLAWHLGILEKVVSEYSPLYLQVNLMPALDKEYEKLRPHQPAIFIPKKALLHLLERGELQACPPATALCRDLPQTAALWEVMVDMAKSFGGFAVLPAPLLDETPIIPTIEDATSTISAATLAQLLCEGRSRDQLARVLRALDIDANDMVPSCAIPHRNDTIIIDTHLAEKLAAANVLERACSRYKVLVEPSGLPQIKEDFKAFNRRKKIADSIKDLKERVHRLIVSKKIQFFETAELGKGENPVDPIVAQVRSLLSPSLRPGDILWIDDRALNCRIDLGVAKVICVADMLSQLRSKECLSQREYFELLHRIRKMGIRFIPPSSEEFAFWFSRVANSKPDIPVQLQDLSSYVAACLSTEGFLIPDSTEPGEGQFVREVIVAVQGAVADVFTNPEGYGMPPELAADWLIVRFPFDGRCCMDSLGLSFSLEEARKRLANDIFRLYIATVDRLVAPGNFQETMRRLGRFVDWFLANVLDPRLYGDPRFGSAMSRAAEDFYRDLDGVDSKDAAAIRVRLDFFCERLFHWFGLTVPPGEIAAARLGIANTFTIGKSRLEFTKEDFFSSVCSSLAGESAELQIFNSSSRLRLVRCATSAGFELLNIANENANDGNMEDFHFKLDSPPYAILTLAPAERRSFLIQNRVRFDLRSETLEKLCEQVESLEDSVLLFETVESAWSESLLHQLLRVLVKLRTEEMSFGEVAHAVLPSSWSKVLEHFRLDNKIFCIDGPALTFSAGASELLESDGLKTSLQRYSRLPIPLPEAIIKEIAGASHEQRVHEIKSLSASSASPLGCIHALALCLRFIDDIGMDELCSSLIQRLGLAWDNGHFDLLGALLVHLNLSTSVVADSFNVDPSLRLAVLWGHAAEVIDVMVATQVDTAQVARLFYEQIEHPVNSSFFLKDDTRNDLLHPDHFNALRLLVHATSALCEGIAEEQLIARGVHNFIRERASRQAESLLHLHPHLLWDPGMSTNRSSSLLVGTPADYFRLIKDDGEPAWERAQWELLIDSCLDRLLAEPASVGAWSFLRMLIAWRPITEPLRLKAINLVLTLDPILIFGNGDERVLHALTFESSLVADGEGDLANKFDNDLEAACYLLAEQDSNRAIAGKEANETERSRRLSYVMEAIVFSSRANSSVSGATRFTQMYIKVMRIWPLFGKTYFPFVLNMVKELPPETAEPIWPLIHLLRASYAEEP
jgi:hypothetical protein